MSTALQPKPRIIGQKVRVCIVASKYNEKFTDSLVETVVARDVLGMHSVAKPTLLSHLFALSARFPAQILSYNKMLMVLMFGEIHIPHCVLLC